MQVPSGQVFQELDLEFLTLAANYGFIQLRDEPIKLNSGVMSRVYVSGREDITDNPKFEWIVGRKIARLVAENSLPDDKQPCLIGIPTAGTSLAQAAAMVSLGEHILTGRGYYICHRAMRENLKEYGLRPKWVNGYPQPDLHTYWSVDNVITDGQSKFEANDRLRASGYPVDDMPSLVFVDRQQGGIQNMEKAGFGRIVVAYLLLDIVFAFGELGFWPKEAVRAVEEEIKAHQLLK